MSKTIVGQLNGLFIGCLLGNFVLVTASVDVDKTDKSYYGVSHLYCISIKQECFQVPLEKPGPLYCVEWAPHGREFCVCYGFMPSKVYFLFLA